MIPKSCKRLAEVDFPIAVVSRHSAREKSIRHGHPSTLHLWWARRPLAACRSMLLALLLPDPCDEHCPTEFKDKARGLLPQVMGKVGQASSLSETQAGRLSHDLDLRNALLKFIGDFANWDLAANPRYLEVGRGLVKAAHGDASGMMPEPPLVVDPFAGGGSIPLEALRLGCDAFASDLNPVACLILKVMLGDIPRHGPELADELRKVGAEIKKQAEKELSQYYPPDPDGATPIAYLWARTVRCESPNCGAEIPLMRSFWLCKKSSRLRALRYRVVGPETTGWKPVPQNTTLESGTGFQPVNPWKSPELAARARNLPHLEAPQATYFVTFRCRDRIFLATDEARDAAMSAIRHWDDHRIDLDAAVVMPDHAHMMFRIVDGSDLSSILHSIKSFSAKQIGKLTGSRGSVWQDESFDHIIRHETAWAEKLEYVRLNPVTRGLVDSPQDYRWLYVKSHRQDACATGESGSQSQIVFEVFTPKSEKEVPAGTVTRAKATCLACERVLAPDRVRAQLREQRGGADTIFEERKSGTGILPVRVGGARLLAVVTLGGNTGRMPVPPGRQYRVATDHDYEAAWKAQKAVAKLANQKLPNGISTIPDEPLPPQGTLGFRVQLYGMTQWGDLFTARQTLSMICLLRCLAALKTEAAASKEIAGLALSRFADICNSLCQWESTKTQVRHLFTRQAIPILWDFAEPGIFADQAGDYSVTLATMADVIDAMPADLPPAQVLTADACHIPLPDDAANIWFTDPPYYDAIPYSDLSDFFFVWLKRVLPDHPLIRDPFDKDNPLTPKNSEIVQDETKQFEGSAKNREFFERMMASAFAEGRRVTKDDSIGSVVFAHKTTEGWEALLSGIVKGGWVITGSWPIATEAATRLRARDSAALATSVHLVCRPRIGESVGDWADVLRELPDRIGDWMERLSSEGVRGADLVFACIGPAMEVYSRYSKVEDAEGREIQLGGDPEASEPHKRGFLAYVWEIVGRTALGQVLGTAEARARNGAAGALEEDARLTALFLWTLQSTALETDSANGSEDGDDADDEDDGTTGKKKGLSLIYDVVRRFSQPLGIHLENWNDRIIATEKGVVRLLPITERAEHLLGEDGATGVADVIERTRGGPINYQFAFAEDAAKKAAPATDGKGRKRRVAKSSDEAPTMQPGTTTLDRVHIAMLLQSAGKSNALRTMLKAETDRAPDFLRLANALSALYPKDSEEKRLLDAMLLAVPR